MYPIYLTKRSSLVYSDKQFLFILIRICEYNYWFHNTNVFLWESFQFISFQELDTVTETAGQHTEYFLMVDHYKVQIILFHF